ncbi:MAG: hypothetical protein KC413_16405, partial [Anaerolineales bacterium]|nr:hypothetical protein [Anaerolineales bacterium]
IHPDTKEPVTGEYTAGWVKRGPSGVIGTNKPDSVATVDLMMADLQNGRYLHPTHPEAEAIASLIAERQPQFFSYADWQKLDELETAKGAELGRPRLKFTCVEDMLAAVGKA